MAVNVHFLTFRVKVGGMACGDVNYINILLCMFAMYVNDIYTYYTILYPQCTGMNW